MLLNTSVFQKRKSSKEMGKCLMKPGKDLEIVMGLLNPCVGHGDTWQQ